MCIVWSKMLCAAGLTQVEVQVLACASGRATTKRGEGGRRKGGLAPPWDCARLCDAPLLIHPLNPFPRPTTNTQVHSQEWRRIPQTGRSSSPSPPLFGRRGRDFVLLQSPLPHVHVGSQPVDLSSQSASCLPLHRSPHQARGRLEEAVRLGFGGRRLMRGKSTRLF